MTNKEKYKQAFSALHTSDTFSVEVEKMAGARKSRKIKVAAAIAGCVLVIGGAGTAYATDVGGIQRTVQIWLHGDQTSATLDMKDDGTYDINYVDEDGNDQQIFGGGVAMDTDGTERSLTADEVMEQQDMPDVEYLEDGTVWLYYHSQKIELTDKFEDGVCYVTVTDGAKTLYVTVKYQNGFAVSEDNYASPDEFDCESGN